MFNITHDEKVSMLHDEIEKRYDIYHSWTDSIVSYCTENDIEAGEIVPFLSPSIVERLKTEAILNKTIKGQIDTFF